MAHRPNSHLKQSASPNSAAKRNAAVGLPSGGDRRARRRTHLSSSSSEQAGRSLTRAQQQRSPRLDPRSQRRAQRHRRGKARPAAKTVPLREISSSDLSQRRQTLRRQRSFNLLKGGWRLLAVGGAAAGLGWVMMQPLWVLKTPQQIRVKGYETLNAESIKALLPLEYPQSLLTVKPLELETVLLESAPLRSASVSRQLLPPGLRVQVQERRPVALAELAIKKDQQADLSSADASAGLEQTAAASTASGLDESGSDETGSDESAAEAASPRAKTQRPVQVLLDEAGDWVPLDRYTSRGQGFELPQLKVIGMREEYREPWSDLYLTLSQSPVEVFEIDWRDPSNLKLQTELGEAHLGPYGNQFSQQLQVLDRMRDLPEHQQASQVAFIDLRSPTLPRLRMKSQSASAAE